MSYRAGAPLHGDASNANAAERRQVIGSFGTGGLEA